MATRRSTTSCCWRRISSSSSRAFFALPAIRLQNIVVRSSRARIRAFAARQAISATRRFGV
ncbi:hypothetical protein ABZY36_06180 [Streptomyces sp. NPDC006627]|uniref:hypothetical protein n=1 Tax=Streptomyces sp. NPDC006627 TaxID=3154679 RepID=UPI00339EF70F